MLDQIRIVLVNTTHSGNIGAAARAMKNMGVTQLVLVDPIAEIDGDAIVRASGASEILDSCITVSSLDEAVEGCGLVMVPVLVVAIFHGHYALRVNAPIKRKLQ